MALLNHNFQLLKCMYSFIYAPVLTWEVPSYVKNGSSYGEMEPSYLESGPALGEKLSAYDEKDQDRIISLSININMNVNYTIIQQSFRVMFKQSL